MKANRQSALAGLFQDRIDESVKRGTSLPPLELGTIDGNMNLLVDGLPKAMQGYMVCRQLTLGAKDEVLTKTKKDGSHIHSGGNYDSAARASSEHEHEVLISEKMRKLKPGDRVLVAWASSIPVVVDIVYDKSEMG